MKEVVRLKGIRQCEKEIKKLEYDLMCWKETKKCLEDKLLMKRLSISEEYLNRKSILRKKN